MTMRDAHRVSRMVRVQVLGPLIVEDGGLQVDLGGPKPRALLGLLVAADGRPVSAPRLVDEVWGEGSPPRVQASLQSYIARLRRALDPDRIAGGADTVLVTTAGGYALRVPDDAVDARSFARLVSAARDADPTESIQLFESALGLWTGTAYAGLTAPSLVAEAVRLEELRLGALADLWELRLRRGEHRSAVPELEQLVRLNPLRERLWALLATALYRDARQGDALAALRRVRERLADELGVDPGPELQALEQQILHQDPDLLPTPDIAIATTPTAPRIEPLAQRPALIGRERDVEQVDAALHDAAAGRGRLVLVTGEPGIGKSRFAEEVRARAYALGFRTGRGAWEADPCPALWGWERALEQATGSSDALVSAQSVAASAAFQRGQAVLRALAETPTLLVLDDLHWADTESLQLLGRVAAGLADVPVILVATLRDAPSSSDALGATLATTARTDPLRVELAGLTREEVAAWTTLQTGEEVAPAVAAELSERTGGNPLYLVELTRVLIAAGAVDDLSASAWSEVPSGVRDLVRHQTADLPPDWMQVLVVAAAAGRAFDLAMLESVAERLYAVGPETVAGAVEAAQLQGLVDETDPSVFRFTHALVRDALYETLSTPARSRVHAALAAAGEVVHAGRIAEHAGELAEHYRRAGRAHVRSAWVLSRAAATRAASLAAYEEAVRWLASAADLQRDDASASAEERESLLVTLARALTRVARPIDAWDPAALAARSALERGSPEVAADALLSVTDNLGWGWRPAPTWDEGGIALWTELLEGNPEPTVRRAQLLAALSAELLYRPGSAAESTRLADEATALVRRLGTEDSTSLGVLRLAHMALLRPDLVHHRRGLGDEIVGLAARVEDRVALAGAIVARAHDRVDQGRLTEAWSDIIRAREIAEQEYLPETLGVTGWCQATYLLATGRADAAEAMIEECRAFQESASVASVGLDLGHLAMVRDAQGRMSEVEDPLRRYRQVHPIIRELHTLAEVRAGRLDQLRAELGPWQEQPTVSFDYAWLLVTSIRAEVWTALGDGAAIDDLYAALTPYAGRIAGTLPITLRGTVDHWLGHLAAARGDGEVAREHLEHGLEAHRRLGFPLWERRSLEALARLSR